MNAFVVELKEKQAKDVLKHNELMSEMMEIQNKFVYDKYGKRINYDMFDCRYSKIIDENRLLTPSEDFYEIDEIDLV